MSQVPDGSLYPSTIHGNALRKTSRLGRVGSFGAHLEQLIMFSPRIRTALRHFFIRCSATDTCEDCMFRDPGFKSTTSIAFRILHTSLAVKSRLAHSACSSRSLIDWMIFRWQCSAG
ncbi:hypothetical protein L210DRAFT_2372875 [Boletus edulis BED1]|uniref:Uncharacterized protein n=1 Tax=Boletus edulis BED1 TaxID=1328754 RepID=A0AAD4BCS6_BOLED|nr:hypothetical protein L210DRAFT_2372875 [Boletus edulis BED1]